MTTDDPTEKDKGSSADDALSSDEEDSPPTAVPPVPKHVTARGAMRSKWSGATKKGRTVPNTSQALRPMATRHVGGLATGDLERGLVVTPTQIEFEDIQQDLLYVMTFSVRNTTNRTTRLRIVPPTSRCFALNYTPVQNVAPGLDVRAELEFQLPVNDTASEWHDRIIVISEQDRVEVPLRARRPAPRLEFDSLVNFGMVATGEKREAVVHITNVGRSTGLLELELESADMISLTPSKVELAPTDPFMDTAAGEAGAGGGGAGVIMPSPPRSPTRTASGGSARPAGAAPSSRGGGPTSEDTATARSGLPTPGTGGASRGSKRAGSASGGTTSGADSSNSIGTTASVVVRLDAKTPGRLRTLVKVLVDGREHGFLDINANIMNQELDIKSIAEVAPDGTLLGGGPLRKLAFNNIFFGDSATIRALLVNPGPLSVPFEMQLQVDAGDGGESDVESEDGDRHISHHQRHKSGAPSLVQVIPSSGTMEPFSEQEVEFVMCPPPPRPSKGFARTEAEKGAQEVSLSGSVVVRAASLSQSIPLVVSGSASLPVLRMKPGELRFNRCMMGDRREAAVELCNGGTRSFSFRFPNRAHFSVSPPKGSLEPAQTMNVVVCFAPAQLGKFRTTLPIEITGAEQCPVQYSLPVLGAAGKDPTTIAAMRSTGSVLQRTVFSETGPADPSVRSRTQGPAGIASTSTLMSRTSGPAAYPREVDLGMDRTIEEPVIDLPEPETRLWLHSDHPDAKVSRALSLRSDAGPEAAANAEAAAEDAAVAERALELQRQEEAERAKQQAKAEPLPEMPRVSLMADAGADLDMDDGSTSTARMGLPPEEFLVFEEEKTKDAEIEDDTGEEAGQENLANNGGPGQGGPESGTAGGDETNAATGGAPVSAMDDLEDGDGDEDVADEPQPRLTFSSQHVMLPPVPLAVTTRAVFHIVNAGYDNLEVEHYLPPHAPPGLKIEYPEGNDIGVSRESIPVHVSFRSDSPVSFRVKFIVCDPDGAQFDTEISGMVDNCLLTNSSYIVAHGDSYGFHAPEGKPIKFLHTQQLAAAREEEMRERERSRRRRAPARHASEAGGAGPTSGGKESRGASHHHNLVAAAVPEGVQLEEPEPPAETEDDVRQLVNWLNANVCRTPITQFPGDLIRSHGSIAIDALEQLSGKRVPGSVKGVSKQRSERAAQLRGQYTELLRFITASGGHLTLEPELLMSWKDCLAVKKTRVRDGEIPLRPRSEAVDLYNYWESTHTQRCLNAWYQVFSQALRAFVVERVTYKQFSTMPGVVIGEQQQSSSSFGGGTKRRSIDGSASSAGGDASQGGNGSGGGKSKKASKHGPPDLTGSNVYSVGEAIFLKWLTYHVERTCPPGSVIRRLSDFTADLADCSAYCHAVASHVPEVANDNGPLHGFVPFTESAELAVPLTREENANRLISAMQALRMDIGVTVEDLLQPTPRSSLLLAAHLFQTLPQFLPRATIEFSGVLGTDVVKNVELRNPSRVPVMYTVSLEGATEFSIPENSITLPPGGREVFAVVYRSKFSHESTGKLTFWSSRRGATAASSMVFSLKASVSDRQPLRTQQKTVHCFEFSTVTVLVENPTDRAVDYTVSVEQSMVQGHRFPAPSDSGSGGGGGKGGKGRRGGKRSSADLSLIDMNSLVVGGSGSGEGKENKESRDEERLRRMFLEPCWSTVESLSLEPQSTMELDLNVLPFLPGTYRAQVVLFEQGVGESSYDVSLTVDLPQPSETLETEVVSGDASTSQFIIKLPSRNNGLEKAFATLTESRVPSRLRNKARTVLKTIFNPPQASAVPYFVHCSSPHYMMPATLPLFMEGGGSGGGSGAATTGSKNRRAVIEPMGDGAVPDTNALVTTVKAGKPGRFPATLIFRPADGRPTDVRVVTLSTVARLPPFETRMEFSAAARQSAVQEIPITNHGDDPWSLVAAITGSGDFGGPKTLKVDPGERAMYPLTFHPKAQGRTEGVLAITNPTSKESFQYNLVGVGESPLAEDSVVISCGARETVSHVFNVQHLGGKEDTVFQVETDLPYAAGASEITVPRGSSAEYTLSMRPQLGGTYTGSVTFTAEDGEYQWYTVEAHVGAPAAESELDIESTVRKAVVVEISLQNPLNDALDFQVLLNGEGLLGDSTFSLPAQASEGTYELYYSPLVPKHHEGSVTFVNDRVGELWYKLHLTGHPAAPTELESIECMVGSTASREVTVENPLEEPVVFTTRVSDLDHFAVEPPEIAVEPFGSAVFTVQFTPSSLTEAASADIVLSHPGQGDIVYSVTGQGMMPGVMPEQVATATIGEPSSHMFPFRNTFNRPLPVDVYLRMDEGEQDDADGADGNSVVSSHASVSEDGSMSVSTGGTRRARGGRRKHRRTRGGKSVSGAAGGGAAGAEEVGADEEPPFSLLMRKCTGIVVAPLSTMQISVSFSPTEIVEKRATVEVRGSLGPQELRWVFPLRGIAEAPRAARAAHLMCRAKATANTDMEVQLNGLTELEEFSPGQGESFSHEIVLDDDSVRHLVQRSLTVVPLRSSISSPHEALRYRIMFEPLKPFSTTVELVIIRRTGGRWRFEISLDATDPEPDDTITVLSAINESARVSFKLTNRFLGYSPFQAHFASGSSVAFSVQPPSGVLPPFGGEGTPISVTFSPTEYGTSYRGLLVVQTPEVQWTYVVVGVLPGFKAPTNVSSKVSTQLSPELQARLGRRKSPTKRLANLDIEGEEEARGTAGAADSER